MYKRIMIIGCPGSGKSTFSKRLQEKTKLPLIHLDKEYFKDNWVPLEDDVWKEKMKDLTLGNEWILDGNYLGTMDLRIKRADLIIFFNINRFTCLYRVIKRALKYRNKKRPDMADNCNEKIDIEFYKFILSFNKNVKPKILKYLEDNKNITCITVKNNKTKNNILTKLGGNNNE